MDVTISVDSVYDFERLLWGQGLETFNNIAKEGFGDDLIMYLEDLFCCDEKITDTVVNDFLAYELNENEFLAEHMVFSDLYDLNELKDVAKRLNYLKVVETIEEVENAGLSKVLLDRLIDEYDSMSLYNIFLDLEELNIEDL